jgi:hypothetical protein
MAEKLALELTREKETPGTVRFQEQDLDEDPKVGTLYVKKAASKRLAQPDAHPGGHRGDRALRRFVIGAARSTQDVRSARARQLATDRPPGAPDTMNPSCSWWT